MSMNSHNFTHMVCTFSVQCLTVHDEDVTAQGWSLLWSASSRRASPRRSTELDKKIPRSRAQYTLIDKLVLRVLDTNDEASRILGLRLLIVPATLSCSLNSVCVVPSKGICPSQFSALSSTDRSTSLDPSSTSSNLPAFCVASDAPLICNTGDSLEDAERLPPFGFHEIHRTAYKVSGHSMSETLSTKQTKYLARSDGR
ncbi:hypothetical protein EIP91_006397 [Steccherinum ochraceum]|uniref:Uncharacterized protein n=1 Tax=Steccherinum ochraceum TaxID=92696 RepID=A0A4R0RKG0_9APHY|nr:hypothetical protein EIP91_006397 [Steccherinum ochraceum]